MNTFDRHLLREWLQIFGLVLAATCGLLLVHVLYDDFRDLQRNAASMVEFLEFIAIKIPGFFAIVLPFALLVSLLYALGKMHRGNEFTAMRAAGVGFGRLMAPIWMAGLLGCGLTWWLNTTIVPWSIERAVAKNDELMFRRESKTGIAEDRIGAVYSIFFDNRQVGRMWVFNRFSKKTQRAFGVSVSELDAKRREVRRLIAAEAWREPGQGWRFVRGRELTFAPDTGELLGSKPFEEHVAPNYREDPQLMLLIDQKPTDLSFFQLRELIWHLEQEGSPKRIKYVVRYFRLIADTLVPLIVIAIAIPFAVSGVRVNPAVGVSKSIGLFFLFYVLSNFAASLATKEIVDPLTAAWLPNIGMAALALWFFARLR